jgi:hypothetical protein
MAEVLFVLVKASGGGQDALREAAVSRRRCNIVAVCVCVCVCAKGVVSRRMAAVLLASLARFAMSVLSMAVIMMMAILLL